MTMYASRKVTHAKYAAAEKADYCNTGIEKFMTTAKLYFFALSFRILNSC